MAIRTRRDSPTGLREWIGMPLEWLAGQTARFSGWFNQERWTNLIIILALVLANLVILSFFLQGQDNRAIAFTILLLAVPLAIAIPEISIALFIVAGTGLIVNAFYYAAPGIGTGVRTLTFTFFGIVCLRAIYEYLRISPAERPRLWSWFIAILVVFWVYYMFHVGYIWIFRWDDLPPSIPEVVLGYYEQGLFRYFDAHMLWIGVLPLMIVLRDLERAKRVLAVIGVVTFLGVASLIWEYFAPLPMFWKVVFQIHAAGETAEGYRVRDPAVMYLMVIGLFYALYGIGFYRGWRTALAVIYIFCAVYGVLITKNRALWAALMAVVPFAVLWKPAAIQARQAVAFATIALLIGAGMFHPTFNQIVTQKIDETMQRWQLNYAYGGDPRNDPSYQARLREKEAWEFKMQTLTVTERLFGKGLEEPYGRYLSLYHVDARFNNPRFTKLYIEKSSMHFPWLLRQLHIGIIGTALLALVLAAALIRTAQAFLVINDPFIRMLMMGIGAGTVAAIGYDMIHSGTLSTQPVLPAVLMWAYVELAFHWQRTGQLSHSES